MPEVGTYWYDRRGAPTVVRVLDDGSPVVYLRLNDIGHVPYNQRILTTSRAHFLATFQREPTISVQWLNVGSRWYNRASTEQVLEIMEGCDWQTLMVTVTNPRGVPLVYSVGDLTQQFIRLEGDGYGWGIFFWVMGSGIRVPFVSEVEARAFAFDTSAILALSTPLRVYRRDSSYRPPLESQAFMQAAQRLVDNEPDPERMEGDFEPITSNVTLDGPTPSPVPCGGTLTVLRAPSLWDHLTSDEEPTT